jgi:hypothetical protein
MNEESIKAITDDLTVKLLKKNADYGGASFDLGLNGNMVETGSEPNFEGLKDTLEDIIGYAIIGLHILKDETIKDKVHG